MNSFIKIPVRPLFNFGSLILKGILIDLFQYIVARAAAHFHDIFVGNALRAP